MKTIGQSLLLSVLIVSMLFLSLFAIAALSSSFAPLLVMALYLPIYGLMATGIPLESLSEAGAIAVSMGCYTLALSMLVWATTRSMKRRGHGAGND